MLLALFAFACLLAGYGASGWLLRWRDPDQVSGPVERAGATLLTGLLVAVGVDWSLALTHLFVPSALVFASIALLVACVPTMRRIAGGLSNETGVTGSALLVTLVPMIPVLVWIVYVMWRGTLLWVTDHDGLAYHMLKASFLVRAHGYGYFDGQIPAITTFPIDYELLLGDVLLLTGTDQITEWVATFTYVAYGFLSGAIAERWWGRGAHVVVAMLFAWAVPIAILHSGTHKNDLLFAVAVLGAAHFGARWATSGKPGPYVLMAGCAALAGGTKVSGVFPAAALVVPFVVRARAWRSSRGRVSPLVGWAALSIAIFCLFGWATYAFNALHSGKLVAANRAGWGAWNNLWMFTYLLFARPFSPPSGVWVPWRHEPWTWNPYDLYMGTLGLATSLCLLALPLGIWRYRAQAPERARERVIASAVVAMTAVLIIPAYVQPPLGFFAQHTRYMLCVPPILASWTLVPLVRELAARFGHALGVAATFAYATVFAVTAVQYGQADIYASFPMFVEALRHPERFERADLNFFTHAGSWVDRVAGPDDVIAFDGSFDSWPYPALGRDRTRKLVFLHPDDGPVVIPDDVQWVCVDRGWNRMFNSPNFRDFGDWPKAFGHGRLEPVDIVTETLLSQDPRFEAVYVDPMFNQAVFRRVTPPKSAP